VCLSSAKVTGVLKAFLPESYFDFVPIRERNNIREMSIDQGSSAIMIPKDTRLKDDPKNYVNVGVTIANTGSRAGTEIVELYATPSFSCPFDTPDEKGASCRLTLAAE
jgi:hypothetical protein